MAVDETINVPYQFWDSCNHFILLGIWPRVVKLESKPSIWFKIAVSHCENSVLMKTLLVALHVF